MEAIVAKDGARHHPNRCRFEGPRLELTLFLLRATLPMVRPYFVCALMAAACSSSSTPASTAAFVATDPPGGSAPPWSTSESTVGVCTPGGFIEALPSTNNGSGNVPNFEYPPTWFSCPDSACESAGTYLVQCNPSLSDAESLADVEAAAPLEASVDAAAPIEASVDAAGSVDGAGSVDAAGSVDGAPE
jgi:hypothetical protein